MIDDPEDAADFETATTDLRLRTLRTLARFIDPATLGLTEILLLTDLLAAAMSAQSGVIGVALDGPAA